MKKNLVTIIIPTYKRPGMLARAIDSCLKQTYKNIEILVVDDNNPDTEGRKETEIFMDAYKGNKKIKYIKRDKNGGGCASRNTGIENANGEYIAFLDDDDYFYDDKIEHQLSFMEKNNLDASFTGNEVLNETTNKIIKRKLYNNFDNYDNILKFHIVEMIVGTQTFMYKKSVLEKLKGFKQVPAGQEYYLMYRTIIKNFKVGYLDEILTTICIHADERITTSGKKIEAEKFLYNLKKKHFDILNYSEKQQVKYIYKYNIWQKYKNAGNFKQYLWLIYIIISHPIRLIRRFL